MSLNNNFTQSSNAPSALVVSGDFYDFKRYLKSIVNINLSNTARVVTHYSIQINNTTANPDTTTTPVNVITLLSKGETSTEKRVEVEIIHSAVPSPTLKDGNIEYAFTDGYTYCIKHVIVIKEIVGSATQTYNYTYHQDFRYYATPVTLSDFSFNDIQNGDTLEITGLTLVKDSFYSTADSTYPEYTTIVGITTYPMRFTIQEILSSDSCNSVDIYYEMPYVSGGNYDLSNIQLTIGKSYKVSVEASWLLGYSTSKESSQTLSILDIPEITAVEIANLYLYSSTADVVTITTSAITSPASNPVSKIWFEFYNSSNVLQARAGHATNGFQVSSTNNVSTSNEYSLKLSDITSGSLSNNVDYKVKAKVQYTNGEYRTSASFPTTTGYKNFTNTIPVIVSNTINSLYTSDPTEKILDIVVQNDAYQLIAPNETDGIKFHFYDGDTDTLVASTDSYDFVNSSGGANYSYPILLSEVNSVGGAYLVNDTDYRIKAEVIFTDFPSRLSVLSSATTSIPDEVNFAKTIPVIVSSTINSLYTSDPTEKILDIEVEKQAYQLYAPDATNGIKFHFYDGDTDTLVASTDSYDFVNSSGGANYSYPILLSEVNSVGGAYLVNDTDYRIKAEVTLVKHDASEELRLSLSDEVNFAKTIPEIVSNTINSLYTSDPTEKILDIEVKNDAYQLYAPNATNGIKFHFYDDDDTLVASTDSYDFVNSSGGANYSYPILLSEVNSVGGAYLVNDTDYRIKAEVTLVKHDASEELRLSALSAATESIPDKVNFSLKRPVINSITSYDLQNDGDTGNSATQVIAAISVNKQLYKLVAPTSTAGIRFLIYASGGTTLVATTDSYDFVNSSSISFKDYNIKLDEVNLESGQNELSNGITYKVKAEVTITEHSGDTELRLSAAFTDLKGSQDAAPLVSVTISNTWALATNNDPSSSPTRFNASPLIGISGYFKKTPQFNGGSTLNHLDVTSTKFKIEYQVDEGLWANVQKAVLLQKSSSESLQEAVSRVSGVSVVSSPSGNGEYANVVGSGPGQDQEEMIFFIPQQQFTGYDAFTESNEVNIKISIIDSVNMWQSVSGSTTAPRESNSIQLINKINTYDFVAGQSSEPWNSLNGSNLFLNIPVDWNSIHADSVKVGVKYSSGGSYTYTTFDYDSTTSEVQIGVDPGEGTTLYYSVAYIVDNVNISSTATTEGLTNEKSVENKFFPSSTDYAIATTSYTTFNTGGKSSIKFDLEFNAAATSRIDGVNVYFTSPNTTQGSNIGKTRIYTFSASQGGNNKVIQLLHAGSTINYSSTANSTLLNIITASGTIEASSSKIWQDYDFATISFEAYRDSRVVSTNAVYDTEYYEESGSSDFGKTIWNVPFLNAPRTNGAITLEGGVRNSDTATKLSWMQVTDSNTIPFTYDLTMKKNDVSSPLIHNNSGLTTNEKILTIDPDTNAKYTIELALVFAPTTTDAMREVSAHPNIIEFHTIYVDVSGINILVNHPSTTSIVSLSFNDAAVSGDSVTSGASESASFAINIDEQYVMYSTTNPTNALTRLDASSVVDIERIVSPATLKQFTLPVTSVGTEYSFFMRLKAHIKYNVTEYIGATFSTPYVVTLTTDSVEINDDTTTTTGSQYIVSSIPIITTFTNNIVSDQDYPTLSINLDANGLEDEGFISVLIILGQDGTENKIDGEGVLLLFPDTGANFDLSTSNLLGGSDLGVGDARLAGGESYTSTPRNLHGSTPGTLPVSTGAGDYVLTIGSVDSTTGRYNNSTLTMPVTSSSGFLNDDVNYMIAVTTRRGTNFAVGTFTYVPPAVVDNINITRTGEEYFVNFDLNTL